jgi:alkanesulfonate monooxygenase SsuD/methylene tetrahydromethanopterin reductase-like flavin-dependent oxidoreductase (luciferase family)
MKLGIGAVSFGKRARVDLDLIQKAESLGFDSAWTAEAYGNDAVSTATRRSRSTPQPEALELLAEEML